MNNTLDLFEDHYDGGVAAWVPTAEAANARLLQFLPKAGKAYAAGRNYDFGEGKHGNVSQLSPFTRHRLILEEDILRETFSRHSYASAEKFVQEVFWRTYFKGWLEQRPQVWQNYLKDVVRLDEQLAQNSGLRTAFEEATEARTGIECFDAWVGELLETGYLHNHARMWFASIWIFTLKLPWQLGAKFMFENLLDGDPASNTLSWRWVGGLHTQGKTYLARADNIHRYTDGRFNPRGQLAGSAEPLAFDEPGSPLPFPDARFVDLGQRLGCLLTAEDCMSETLPNLEKVQSAAMLISHIDAEGHRDADLKREFKAAAVKDAGQRFANQKGVPVQAIDKEDWMSEIVDWARSEKLETIVTAYAPKGPIASSLDSLEKELSDKGIKLARQLREYDRVSWPHAKKGFFALKQKIPGICTELSLI